MSGLPFRRKELFKITRRTVRPIFLWCLTLCSASCGPRAALEGGRAVFVVAEATYWAAVARWPAARITLRQGIRVVHDTG